jgi:hypothetical protein
MQYLIFSSHSPERGFYFLGGGGGGAGGGLISSLGFLGAFVVISSSSVLFGDS